MNDVRPVWLTRKQRDDLRSLMFGEATVRTWQTLAPIVNAWNASPANAEAAVSKAIELYAIDLGGEVTALVLDALGRPKGDSA